MNDILKNHKITFIGAGNMATAILGGLLKNGVSPSNLYASTARPESAQKIQNTLGIKTTTDNIAAINNTDTIVLCVKPNMIKTVCCQIGAHITPNTLIISVAAGITVTAMQNWLNHDNIALVRCMPNTPSSVGLGASGLYANTFATKEQKQIANELLDCVGKTVWVNSEALLDSVTAISGSAPAYFFLMMEAMIDAAIKQGLDAEDARTLAVQTALGTATLAEKSDEPLSVLRQNVTSPKGTTERALNTLNEGNYTALIAKAMDACRERATQIANEYSQ